MGRIKREKRLKRQKAKRRAQNQRKPELDDSEFWRPWNSVLRQAENSGEGGCGNCGECSLACCTARAVKYPDDDAMVTEFDIAQAIGDRINRRYAAGIGLPATLLEKFAPKGKRTGSRIRMTLKAGYSPLWIPGAHWL